MRRLLSALFLAALLPVLAFAGDDVVEFAPDDPVMSAAVADARETLPRFLDNVFGSRKRAPDAAALKVAIPTDDQGGAEVIWVDALQRTGANAFRGKLANEPNQLPGMSLGSPVRFNMGAIRDWGYADPQSGKMFGHYTTRVVIRHIPKAQRRQVEELLARNPMPANW